MEGEREHALPGDLSQDEKREKHPAHTSVDVGPPPIIGRNCPSVVLLREEGRLLSLCLPTRRGVYGHTRLCVRRRQICTNTLVGRSAIS